MDLLDRLLAHDSWTTNQLLDRAKELADEQLDRDFDIGHRTLRSTFAHIIHNMDVWSTLLDGEVPAESSLSANSIAKLQERLDFCERRLSRICREVRDRDAWDQKWTDPIDKIEKTYGGAIAHIITHSMHHRAQLLYMLRRSGLKDLPEGDVLSWEAAYNARGR